VTSREPRQSAPSVKFPNFRSLRMLVGVYSVYGGERHAQSKGTSFSLTGDTRAFLTFIHPANSTSLSSRCRDFSSILLASRPSTSLRPAGSYLMHRFASAPPPPSSLLALGAYLASPHPCICVVRFQGGVNGLFRLGPTGN